MKLEDSYLYKKVVRILVNNGNNGNMKLAELQERLTRFRIEKREALEIVKELEKGGLVVLDVKRGVNQHLKIRVCSKGTARIIVVVFIGSLYLFTVWFGMLNVLGLML